MNISFRNIEIKVILNTNLKKIFYIRLLQIDDFLKDS